MLYKKFNAQKMGTQLGSSPILRKPVLGSPNVTMRSPNLSDSSVNQDEEEEDHKSSSKQLNKSFDAKTSSPQQPHTVDNKKGNADDNLINQRLEKLINLNTTHLKSPVQPIMQKTDITQIPIIEVNSPPQTERKKIIVMKKPPFVRKNKFIEVKWEPPSEDFVLQFSPKRPAECIKAKAKDLIQEQISLKKQFVDSEFPPNISSLVALTKFKPCGTANSQTTSSFISNSTANKIILQRVQQQEMQPSKQTQMQLTQQQEDLNNKSQISTMQQQSLVSSIKIYRSCNSWLSAKALFSKYNVTLTKYVDPIDLEGGMLTKQCKLMAVLSALADVPSRVQRLLEDQQYNESGCYYVRICKDGFWRYIVLDDFFPVHISSNKIAQSHAFIEETTTTATTTTTHAPANKQGDMEIWAALIEKAVIKTYGCYQDYEMFNPSLKELLRELTGAPTKEIDLVEDQQSYEDKSFWISDIKLEISRALQKKQIVILSKEPQKTILQQLECEEKKDDKSPQLEEYSFTVLSCNFMAEEQDNLGKQCNILEIRNFEGWNQELDPEAFVEKLENKVETGVYQFNMDFLLKHFSKLTVAYVEDSNYYIARQMRHLRSAYSINSFKLTKPASFALEVSQIDKRLFRAHLNADQSYRYSFVRIILVKMVAGEANGEGNSSQHQHWELVDAASGCDKVVSLTRLNQALPEGEYHVITAIDWNSKVYDYCLSFYGPEKINLKRIEFKSMPNFISAALQEATVLNGSRNKDKQLVEYTYANEKAFTLSITVENKGNTNQVFVKDLSKIDRSSLELMSLLDEKQASRLYQMLTQQIISQQQLSYGNVTIELKPGEKRTIVFKIINYSVQFDNNIYKKLGLK